MNYSNRSSNLVAGAAAEGFGVILGWQGHGPLTREHHTAIALSALIPRELLPAAKDPSTQLSRAMRAVAGSTFNDEQIKRGAWEPQPGDDRAWAARWVLVSRTADGMGPLTAGASYGEVVLRATLYTDMDAPELVIEVVADHAELEPKLRAAFDSRIGSEIYVAADVTAWIAGVLANQFDAVRIGGNWYVPQRFRAQAELLCEKFSAEWGRGWMAPIPIATSGQLSVGLAKGLIEEVGVVVGDITKARQIARDDGRDISERAAQTLMHRLRYVGERVAKYADILGEDHAGNVRESLHDAMVELDGVLGAHDFAREWASFDLAAKRAA